MRAPHAKSAARNAALFDPVRELKAEHPFGGCPRIWA